MEFDYQPEYTITSEMLEIVAETMETLGKIATVGDLSKQPALRRINRLKSVHSSAAIEGNTLTLEQVKAVINGKTVLAPQNEILEIKNAFEAYNHIGSINPKNIKDMLKIHGIMMAGGLCDEPGRFRSKPVGIYSGTTPVHIAPPVSNVQPLITRLFEWLEKKEVHPLIKSSIFHYEFEFIHPFNDGNGRMGRFMQSAILAKWKSIFAWIPIETVIKKRQAQYYQAFKDVQGADGKSNAFIMFMLNAILEAVKNLQIDSNKFIKSQTTQVQKLMEVLEHDRPLSAKDIAELLGLKSIDGLKKNYLDPAIKLGLVGMTESEKPRSKHQKYFRAQ